MEGATGNSGSGEESSGEERRVEGAVNAALSALLLLPVPLAVPAPVLVAKSKMKLRTGALDASSPRRRQTVDLVDSSSRASSGTLH